MAPPPDQPPVPDDESTPETDYAEGTGPAQTTLPPHKTATASPVEAFHTVNPSGGPQLEVDDAADGGKPDDAGDVSPGGGHGA